MAVQILMPALSPTMEEGTLSKWVKKEGDTVSAGDVIAEIETDKATMEVEAVDEGILGKILVAEGTEGVKVNSPIAVLLEEGDDASAVDTVGSAAPAPVPAAPVAEAAPVVPAAPAAPVESVNLADPDIPAGTKMVTRLFVKPCATRWLRKCARTKKFS